MASPQKENGYTPIANELLEAMITFYTPSEVFRVFLAIMRKTYGYNKKEDALANSQIVEITGMKKGNVSRSIARLVEHQLVIKADNKNGKGNILRINKDYQQWIPFVIKADNKKKSKKKLSRVINRLSTKITKVITTDNKKLSPLMDTKERNTLKDNIQKKGYTPKENAERFFEGVLILVQGGKVDWLQEMLSQMASKNPNVKKGLIWSEVKKFCDYWTERNSTGTREKWQLQKTFEVDKRLVTWIRRATSGEFSPRSFPQKPKGRKIRRQQD